MIKPKVNIVFANILFKIDSEHFSVTNTQAFLFIQNKLQFQDNTSTIHGHWCLKEVSMSSSTKLITCM